MRNFIKGPYHAARSRFQGPEAYPLHDHDFGEVFWVEEGAFTHCVNGERVEVRTGDCVFIRPWDFHAFTTPGRERFEIVNICFPWPTYQGIRQRHFDGEDLYGEALPLPRAIRLLPGQVEWARAAFITLLKGGLPTLQIERFLINLIAEFIPPRQDERPATQAPLPLWMEEAMRAIRRPEALQKGVPEFYRLCGRCPEHVSREFHRQTGATVVQWINRLRMEHAAALLAATPQEIVEIGLDCGFESLSHFYACFRKAYGLAPSAYRRKAQSRLYPETGDFTARPALATARGG